MNMKRYAMAFVIVIGIFCQFGGFFCQASPTPVGIWVLFNEPWQRTGVPDDMPNLSWASASIIRFCADGTFIRVEATLYKSGTHVNVGASDGLTTYAGTWKQEKEGIRINYELTFAEIMAIGKDEREGKKECTAHIIEGRMHFEDGQYEPNNGQLREDGNGLRCLAASPKEPK